MCKKKEKLRCGREEASTTSDGGEEKRGGVGTDAFSLSNEGEALAYRDSRLFFRRQWQL